MGQDGHPGRKKDCSWLGLCPWSLAQAEVPKGPGRSCTGLLCPVRGSGSGPYLPVCQCSGPHPGTQGLVSGEYRKESVGLGCQKGGEGQNLGPRGQGCVWNGGLSAQDRDSQIEEKGTGREANSETLSGGLLSTPPLARGHKLGPDRLRLHPFIFPRPSACSQT